MVDFMSKKPVLHRDANMAVYFGGSYKFFNALNAGVIVDASPTYMHRINITKAGDAACLITFYDGIDASDSTKIVAIMDGSKVGSYEFGSHQPLGLFVVIAGTTSPNVTFLYSSAITGG
jgi:hypothetical protein